MTIEELYGKILADDELKADFAQAYENGKFVEWVNAQGVDANEQEIIAFIQGAANQKLSVDDVDQVAGGGYASKLKSAWNDSKKTWTMLCTTWPIC